MAKIRILIVDDEPMKIDVIESFIHANCDGEYEFSRALSYERALDHLEHYYDLIICDNFLKDPTDRYGFTFLKEYYQSHGPETLMFLYSVENGTVNTKYKTIFTCHSFDGVKTEILLALGSFPDKTERGTPMEIATADKYNKELCEDKHKNIEKEQSFFNTTLKEIRDDVRKFNSNSLGVLASLVTLLGVEVIKMFLHK